MTRLPDRTGASFSECRLYRYLLWRRWAKGPTVTFVMLNPSTADETTNDPTVARCQRRAVQWGYGGLFVVNLFAWRSTDPVALYGLGDPVGPENDHTVRDASRNSELVVCGWGNHGTLHNRGRQVLGLVRSEGVIPYALKITGAGQPGHPLYIGYAVQPQPI
ncbi:DUF1643 domain-containing protein [Aquisalimonas sp.]|uniref:DUF1643 domain-containing protein n=1 Tax=Aquisalimonas sp. TaxID=1872621 RepID=UPI0025BD18EE|nr:DUF1643 domain-containing protein [Aquisalimonas sp.]